MSRYLSGIKKALITVVMMTAMFSLQAQVSSETSGLEKRLSPLSAGYLERAELMYSEGNYAGVIDQLETLKDFHTQLNDIQKEECDYLLAMSLFQRGEADCVDYLRQFASDWPASPKAIPALLTAADYFFFAHHYNNALAAYLELDFERINPSEKPEYEYRKALSMVKTGLLDEAKPIFLTLKNNSRYSLAADYYLAYIDYAEGNYQKAQEGFLNVKKRMGKSDSGLSPEYYLAQIAYSRGEYENVIEEGKSLLSRKSDNALIPETLRIVGLSYFKTGNYNAARRYLSEYMQTPDYEHGEDAIYALGVIDYEEGDYTSARRRFSALTDSDDEIGQSAWLYLGQIAVEEGDAGAAAIAFSKAASMDYDHDVTETALFNYIAARTKGGNVPFSSSIPMLTEFLEKFPGSRYSEEVEGYLATAYYNEKDYGRALVSINKIKNPDATLLEAKQKILYELGMESMANNRPGDAKKYLTEAYTIKGDRALRAQVALWLGDACYNLEEYSVATGYYRDYLNLERNGENKAIAEYDLGYSLMKQEDYTGALAEFNASLKGTPSLPQKLHDDAIIRIADCQYYIGDYRSALKNYSSAIADGAADSDYATYRRAVMYGLSGDVKTKLRELSEMPERYPSSKWLPDALLEKGETYTGLGDMRNATIAFEELKTTYANSPKVRKGMLDLAIAYMREGDEEKATQAYKELISAWPTSEEARLANEDLRRFYSMKGGLQEYSLFLKSVDGAPSLDADEMEKLTFEGAATLYASDASATSRLEEYVAQYPDGRYLSEALYSIAEGKRESGDEEESIEWIDRLLSQRRDSPEAVPALLMKAQMLEQRGLASYPEAVKVYRQLEERGGSEYAAEAYSGIMRTTSDDRERLQYAALVKNSGGLSSEELEEAQFYEATALLGEGNILEGEKALASLASNPRSLSGAKAAVILGQHYLEEGKPDVAEKILTAFTDEGTPHQYWLARGFIALADVYHDKGKDYLGVEYLKSLQENYPGNELDIHDMISTRLKKWK